MSNDIIYLYVGYTVISLGVFAYLAYLHSKQAGLQNEMDILLGKVKRHAAGKK